MLQLEVWFFEGWLRGRDMVMCAAVRVIICYRREMEKNVDMCCS